MSHYHTVYFNSILIKIHDSKMFYYLSAYNSNMLEKSVQYSAIVWVVENQQHIFFLSVPDDFEPQFCPFLLPEQIFDQ